MDYITQIFLFIFYDISLCNKNTYHYFPEKEKNAADFGFIIYGTDKSELILQSHFHFGY